MDAHTSCGAVGLMPTTTCTSKISRSTKSRAPLFVNRLGGVPVFVIRALFCCQMNMYSNFKRKESQEKNMLTTDEKARTRDIEKLRFLALVNGSYVEVLTTQMIGLRIRTADTSCRPSLFPPENCCFVHRVITMLVYY